MILYQIVHGGYWAWTLTHRLTVMRDKEAVLLVDSSTNLSFGFRVIPFNGMAGSGLKTEQEVEKHTLEI
ncbi:MAG: hypothetical protein LBI40_02075 [Treponema sp.]|jgi:hypothetical protein|nr:hypothetical protein [Treponema sp.]